MNNIFLTQVRQFPKNIKLKYDHKIMLFGSCFSDNIGEKLENLKFDVIVNPFGILYNPLSISKNIKSLIDNDLPKKQELFNHNNIWHSWNHHGKFSDTDLETTYKKILDSFNSAAKAIKNTDLLIITFGTAFVYKLVSTNGIVSNCHKVPSNEFKTKY